MAINTKDFFLLHTSVTFLAISIFSTIEGSIYFPGGKICQGGQTGTGQWGGMGASVDGDGEPRFPAETQEPPVVPISQWRTVSFRGGRAGKGSECC